MDTVISVLIVIGVLLLFLAALMIFKATVYGRVPPPVQPVKTVHVERVVVAEHLSAAIRQATISEFDPQKLNAKPFQGIHDVLERQYPRVHGTLHRERINEHSLLYTWTGTSDLPPVLLCAHLDVVPADPATLNEWSHPPFGGDIIDSCVWGRGAIDMKNSLITILEAVEGLIKAGYRPERTLYLAFGHDEEVGGMHGAKQIAEVLKSRGERLALVLDEGAAVMSGVLPGVTLPVALIGVSEKGYATLELRVEGRAGHSSMPPPHTAIGVLGRAITRIEASPMPARMSLAGLLFSSVGAFFPFGLRFALANTWLLKGAIFKRLAAAPQTNALVRSTFAVTMIDGGVKDNVLPAQARALVNCRMLPGDTREKVLDYVRRAVNDEAVQVFLREEASWEASPVSPMDTPEYEGLVNTIRQVFPDALVAPYLVSGATDSRHYIGLTEAVYRFMPCMLDSELVKTMHGIDERVPVEALERMVQFYTELIRSWTTLSDRDTAAEAEAETAARELLGEG